MRMESPLNQRLRRSPPDHVYTPIDVTSDWNNTPNNDPARLATYLGQNALHSYIATEQVRRMRQYLDTFPEYTDTPIWITEIALHVGYDGWNYNPFPQLVSVGDYNWDKMSNYLNEVIDWLEANAAAEKIDRWFFFSTWKDIVNVGSDGYMGIIFFDGPSQGSSLNCLGETYRARSLGLPKVKCDASGNTVAAE